MFMFPIVRLMALPNLSRFRAPLYRPVGLAPNIVPFIPPAITAMCLRMILPVLPVVVRMLLPVLALVVTLVILLLMVVAPMLVRVFLRAPVFLPVLVAVLPVAVLSACGSSSAQSQNQCRRTEDRCDFHLSSVDCF
jgi:hypothetical protein